MNERKPQRKPEAETKAEPLDPIALSLALWLGLMVGALGLQHLSEEAAAQQAVAQQAFQPSQRAAQRIGAARLTPTQAYVAWGR